MTADMSDEEKAAAYWCGHNIPVAEYGLMMPDKYWRAIAPLPGDEWAGLLCLDCQDSRLRDRVGITLADALAEGFSGFNVYGPPTPRLVELLDSETLEWMRDEWAGRDNDDPSADSSRTEEGR